MAKFGTPANTFSPDLVLTNLGEKMSDDEVDELLKAVDTSSGEINYTDLVRTILAN
jgi:Ca2+-binding EF-hand superfamily protein